ncbi:GH36-type glycosyl hydrolase domain-containing protein [Marinagarivorans cellulosilyticus]|uniref:Cellobionic acid phosphorylase n=1 Tax=Marinagarivorans cellulosilyticus TaxID=2721545 RepID=A0AAN1WGB0_9GAMM|nr:NdvB protein [Marinagarivorans cellulosilyticus]BCD97073.1 cellobionic acid phosphorylase [Marinagarivorans cellulosilyticus]
MTTTPFLHAAEDGQRYNLTSPTAMPRAAAFLWNQQMMIQVNCRGFAIAQHMQPEPGKYAYAPNLEAKTFMQPEQPYFAHHPGRFVYIKDEETGEIFSAPYEPVRKKTESFTFSAGQSDITWFVKDAGVEVTLTVSLPTKDVVELWSLKVKNVSGKARKLSIYPFFTIGYMSWMNQSAQYRQDLGGIVASCITPYQKVKDYPMIKTLKDKTFFLHNTQPTSWEVAREAFEGEGGLHNPDGLQGEQLANGDAIYETPAAVLQYREALENGAEKQYRFLFGPAHSDADIEQLRDKYFADGAFEQSAEDYAAYLAKGNGVLKIKTPDEGLDNFVNNWLGRQVYYHGDVNRLTTDPQTRNYIQDNMGMTYIMPSVTRAAFLHALSQQEETGSMPDGILIHEDAELKYINQIPHTDHCVWVPVCLQAYLDETGDYNILNEPVKSAEGDYVATVFERTTNAMRWLLKDRDERGLNYIAQGDWCDPMNMVGYKGKGVSGWLSVATAYALKLWAKVAVQHNQQAVADELLSGAADIAKAVQTHLWDGDWFGRGITDDGVVFGISKDVEGRIFLNPQSWAMLADIVTPEQQAKMVTAIEEQLETPYGVAMCAPAFTKMREDVGRVTQKWPGSAENGSVYNHAAVFYIYSLYVAEGGKNAELGERAFKLLRQMIPGPDTEDYLQRGQMPVYIPNYYRGAYYQFPRTAGRSSQLFNTGTVSWVYRSLVDGLFGVKGCAKGLEIAPQLPKAWNEASVTRLFRGATFNINYVRGTAFNITVEGATVEANVISGFESGKTYSVTVTIA